jgi:hypothetical protein
LALDSSNDLLVGATSGGFVALLSGATTVQQLGVASTDFTSYGSSLTTAGFVRVPTNVTIVGSYASGANYQILYTDAGPATYLNSPTEVFIAVGGTGWYTFTNTSFSMGTAITGMFYSNASAFTVGPISGTGAQLVLQPTQGLLEISSTSVMYWTSGRVNFQQPIFGSNVSNVPVQWGSASAALTANTVNTLSSTTYQCPIIALSLTSSAGNTNVVLPRVETFYWIDMRQVALSISANLIFSSSPNVKSILFNANSNCNCFYLMMNDGNGSLYQVQML